MAKSDGHDGPWLIDELVPGMLDLFTDHTSAATCEPISFPSMAYVLLCALRWMKLYALLRVSKRRIRVAMPSALPEEFALAHLRLNQL